jgi:hypothetical protein
MRKSRFSASQREAIVSSHLKGSKTVEQLCEAHHISPATFYIWKNELETDKNEDKKRLLFSTLFLQKKYKYLFISHLIQKIHLFWVSQTPKTYLWGCLSSKKRIEAA